MASQPRVIGMIAACPYPSSQGSQVLIRQLAQRLADRGHRVHIITYPYGVPDLPSDAACRLHRARALLPVQRLDPGPSAAKPFLDASLLARVISVAGREAIEILHGHNYEGQIIARAAGGWLGIPVVYHAHTLLADELPTYTRGRCRARALRRFGGWVDRWNARAADHVFAVSLDIVARVRAFGVPPDRVSHLPPGITPEEWPARSYPGEESARRPAGTDPPVGPPPGTAGGPQLVYTGNLAAFQNVPDLLEATRRLRETVPSAHLTVITPSDPRPLAACVHALGLEDAVEVIVEHHFPRIIPRLLSADIGCSARTMRSGFPIKHLDYMAAGLPTVAFAGGATGIVDGETGLVVPDHDVAACAAALEVLARDPARRRRMGNRAREIAFRDYDGDALAARLERVCERVIRDRSRGRDRG